MVMSLNYLLKMCLCV